MRLKELADALTMPGPVLLDIVTNPEEVSVPRSRPVSQGWGFAIAKMKENIESA